MRPDRTQLVAYLLLALSACSTSPPQKSILKTENVRLETLSWLFSEEKVVSPDYGNQQVAVSKIIEKQSGKTILNLANSYPAFEWVSATEGSEGSIATLEHTVEGRASEVPIFVFRKADKKWSEIVFKKSHFSGEVTELKLFPDKIRLRLLIDQGLISRQERTGTLKDQQGYTVDYQDWTYSFKTKTWAFSRKN